MLAIDGLRDWEPQLAASLFLRKLRELTCDPREREWPADFGAIVAREYGRGVQHIDLDGLPVRTISSMSICNRRSRPRRMKLSERSIVVGCIAPFATVAG